MVEPGPSAPGLLAVGVVVDDVVDRFDIGLRIHEAATFRLMRVKAMVNGNPFRVGVE